MRLFEAKTYNNGLKSGWHHGRKVIVEIKSGKKNGEELMLKDPKLIFDEDYYDITRCTVVESVSSDIAPEHNFYVYEINFLIPNSAYYTFIIDEETMTKIISDNVNEFLRGDGINILKEFFEYIC